MLHNALRVNLANIKRRNFRELYLYLFNEDDIRSLFDRIEVEYGPRIVAGKIYFAVTQDKYNGVYRLDPVRDRPWEVSFRAKSKYSLDDLNRALQENDGLLLSLFTLKSKRTGKVEVSVHKGKDGIHLSCAAELTGDYDKQAMAIYEMVNSLAGKDIIDRTST